VAAPSPGAFFAILAVSIGFSLYVFSHATRNGSRHATAWGVFTFLAVGLGLATYFGHYFWTRRRRRR
jgi:hypothetical protein